MKKVITMVGTSIFENYLEKYNENFEGAYRFFKDNKIRAEEVENGEHQNRKNTLVSALNKEYLESTPDASAEIKSLIKLKQELKDDFEIYLLYSDTAFSFIAAKILQNAIGYYDELQKDAEKVRIKKIKGLQVWDRDEFNQGMVNLISTIYNIAQGYWDNMIINITGGYKATIPYLAILAQVNKCPIYYIFENTDALIKIPYIPIDINWKIFEKQKEFF